MTACEVPVGARFTVTRYDSIFTVHAQLQSPTGHMTACFFDSERLGVRQCCMFAGDTKITPAPDTPEKSP